MGFTPLCMDCVRDAKDTRYMVLHYSDNSIVLRTLKCLQCGIVGLCAMISPVKRDIQAENEVALLEKMWTQGVE